MIPVRDEDIGGAVVRRRIDRGNQPPLLAGHRLSRAEVMAIPTANRRALVANEAIWLAPRENALAGVHVEANANKPKLGLANKK